MRILGVDAGQRRIGLAWSADDGVATPYATVAADRTERASAECVQARVLDLGIERIVVGLPLHLNGTEGAAATRARALGEALREVFEIPVDYWDERLTTASAERGLRDIGVRAARRREVVDQSAAALILQGYLDLKAANTWQAHPSELPAASVVPAKRPRRKARG